MQGVFNIPIYVIYHINKLKNKNRMILTDAEKDSDKSQHPFMIRKIKKLESGHRGKLPHIMKARYDKHKADIILNSGKLKAFPVRAGTRQGCPQSPCLLNTALQVPAMAIREENEIKGKRSTAVTVCR